VSADAVATPSLRLRVYEPIGDGQGPLPAAMGGSAKQKDKNKEEKLVKAFITKTKLDMNYKRKC